MPPNAVRQSNVFKKWGDYGKKKKTNKREKPALTETTDGRKERKRKQRILSNSAVSRSCSRAFQKFKHVEKIIM